MRSQLKLTVAAAILGLSLSAEAKPPPGAALVTPAYQAIRAWRFDEARVITTALLNSEAPPGPYMDALLGTMKFLNADYEGAVEQLEAAKAQQLPAALLSELPLAKAAAALTEGYEEVYSEHFILRFAAGKDAILAPFAIETLEAAREKIGARLGFMPEGRVVVEIYPSAASLAKVSGLTEAEIERSGTIALCKYNRLMVTSPRAVVFGYAWRDTLAHELAHLIIGGASKNKAPIWLHEGIAKYIETIWRGEAGGGISLKQQAKLREALEERRLIPFSKLHPSIAKLPSQEASSLAFSEVFSFVQYIVEKEGWGAIRGLLAKLGEGESLKQAVRGTLGSSLKTALSRWKRWLGKQAIVDVAGGHAVKGERALKLKRRDVPDDPLDGLDDRGRRYARAADLLYGRGHYKAAQIELEKAAALTDAPLVNAKLAMVALDNGDLAAATQAAQRALAAQPELAGPNLTLAEVLLRGNKPKEAALPLSRAIDVNPFDPRIHRLRVQLAGQQDDPEAREAAQRALDQLAGRIAPPPSLGLGSAVQIVGAPFSRVYLKPERDKAPTIATGAISPSARINLKPGGYELKLLPPIGPVQTQSFTIGVTPMNGQPHHIRAHSESKR